MTNWSDLVADFSATTDDDELDQERVADLWILLGASSTRIRGIAGAEDVLVALAGPDVARRALTHITTPRNEGLSSASVVFLRNVFAHSSEHELEVMMRSLPESGLERNAAMATLRGLLSGGGAVRSEAARHPGGRMDVLVRFMTESLTAEERLTAAAELASLHSERVPTESASIRSLLSTVTMRDQIATELAGEPRRTIAAEEISDSLLRQARLAGEAMSSIWMYSMLEPSAAAVALGAKPTNREKVRSYRERSWLLGLPRGRGFVYPQFQFDPVALDVYPEVRTVNEMLDATHDCWGVASWWIEINDRIGARPVDLIGSEPDGLEMAARALLEPVG